jgi:hypothetical protein
VHVDPRLEDARLARIMISCKPPGATVVPNGSEERHYGEDGAIPQRSLPGRWIEVLCSLPSFP